MKTKATNTLRFFYNGIKASDGQLQKASYSAGELRNFPAGTITISGKKYSSFSAEVREAFTVENDSDGMADYFVNDSIRVIPTHPLYAEVKAALDKREARFDVRFAKEVK